MTNGRRLRAERKSFADAEAAESRRRRDTKRTSGLVQQVFKTKHTGTEGYNGDVPLVTPLCLPAARLGTSPCSCSRPHLLFSSGGIAHGEVSLWLGQVC